MKKLIGAAVLAMTLAAAPAYAATTTFAQFKQQDGTDTVSFSGGATLGNVAGATVLFDFLDPMPAALNGEIQATMNFTSTGSPYDGTLSFLRVSDNANLLTVSFTDATLTGGGSAGAFFDSEPGVGTIVYTSDFLDFSASTAEDFSLSFSALSSAFGSASWTADATGTFASNSHEQPGGFIPEPASWAMMILGFGGVGCVVRRRRHLMASFA